ncbi:MAG: hypothetical protein AB7I13_06400 [Vicinamibacterales bacterium]
MTGHGADPPPSTAPAPLASPRASSLVARLRRKGGALPDESWLGVPAQLPSLHLIDDGGPRAFVRTGDVDGAGAVIFAEIDSVSPPV